MLPRRGAVEPRRVAIEARAGAVEARRGTDVPRHLWVEVYANAQGTPGRAVKVQGDAMALSANALTPHFIAELNHDHRSNP